MTFSSEWRFRTNAAEIPLQKDKCM